MALQQNSGRPQPIRQDVKVADTIQTEPVELVEEKMAQGTATEPPFDRIVRALRYAVTDGGSMQEARAVVREVFHSEPIEDVRDMAHRLARLQSAVESIRATAQEELSTRSLA